MNENPLLALTELGQSVWIDYLDRSRLASGEVRRHIEQDGLRGMTSNPTIFAKSIAGDDAYDAPIRDLALRNKTPAEIYDAITVEDIRLAADEFRQLYEGLDGHDGFVSLEVSPHLAHDTRATLEEARRLWREVDRPNVMIKVPATREGLPVIEALTAEGINVNVTLLFGLDRYGEVADAYLAGLESHVQRREASRLASVASFFLSRIDVLIDGELDERVRTRRLLPEVAARLRGRVAIASARLAYQRFKRITSSPRFHELAGRGARPQRLLWASTSTKDPAYPDVYYVDALVGKDTINTVPLATFDAYRDHGHPALRLEQDLDEAIRVLQELASIGIDLDDVTSRLEADGVRKFVDSYDGLLATIAHSRDAALAEPEHHAHI